MSIEDALRADDVTGTDTANRDEGDVGCAGQAPLWKGPSRNHHAGKRGFDIDGGRVPSLG